MQLAEITIKNFRGISSLEKLSVSNINTFVGKNDAGKSCILRALECFFDEKKFDPKDVFRGKNPEEKTYIELSFKPQIEINDLAVDAGGYITIKKEFEVVGDKVKPTAFYRSFDFKSEKYQDLWNKKEADLNTLITELSIDPERSGRGKKNIIRIEQIKSQLESEEREERYNLLGELLKNLEKTYDGVVLPEYLLFDAEQDLSVEATNFQSQFKPIISAYFETVTEKTREIESGLRKDLANEFEEIRKFMVKNVPGIKQLNPTTEFNWSKSLAKFDLNLEFTGQAFDVPISHKGTGFKRLLMVAYFEYLASKKSAKNLIFAIEEPETYLHPSAQSDLLDSIIRISEDSQFFLTTHSPVFAGATSGEHSILVTKDDKGFSHYEKGTPGIIQKIISELGIRPDYNLISKSKFLLFLEGASDVQFARIAAKTLLGKDLKDDGIACLIGGGASLANYAELDLFKDVHGANYAVLVDGDNGDVPKQKEKEKIKTRCEADGAIYCKLSKKDIENYCHPDRIKECYLEKIGGGDDSEKTKIQSTIITIDKDTDVEKHLFELGFKHSFKKGLNIQVVKKMSVEDWETVDPQNEVKTFFESIYTKISGT